MNQQDQEQSVNQTLLAPQTHGNSPSKKKMRIDSHIYTIEKEKQDVLQQQKTQPVSSKYPRNILKKSKNQSASDDDDNTNNQVSQDQEKQGTTPTTKNKQPKTIITKKTESEKEKLRNCGYYTKINYNLSEIIEKEIIQIQISGDNNQALKEQVDAQVFHKNTGKQNKKNKNKQNHLNQQIDQENPPTAVVNIKQVPDIQQKIDSFVQKNQNSTISQKKNESVSPSKQKQQQEEQYKSINDKLPLNPKKKNKKKNCTVEQQQQQKDEQECQQTNNIHKYEKQKEQKGGVTTVKQQELQKQVDPKQSLQQDEIQDVQRQIEEIKRTVNNDCGWEVEVLSQEHIQQRDEKLKQLEAELQKLHQKREQDQNLLELEQKQLKIQKDLQIKAKILKKKMRLNHLINVGQKIAIAKQQKGIPKAITLKKYKAVPAGKIEFDLIEKTRKKVSKIKNALKAYRLALKEKLNKPSKNKDITERKEEDDGFVTFEEQEGGEQDNQKVADFSEEEKQNIGDAYAYDEQLEQDEDIKVNLLDQQHQFKLSNQIDENMNLEGVKYNNMSLRGWVDHVPSQQIDEEVLKLVNTLSFTQAIKKINQPKKAKRRIVAGFKEVLNTMKSNSKDKQCKCVIIALNLQYNPLDNGSDQLVLQIIQLAEQKSIPVIHSCNRSRLGKAYTGKFGPRIGVLCVLNCDIVAENLESILKMVNEGKKQLKDNLQDIVSKKKIVSIIHQEQQQQKQKQPKQQQQQEQQEEQIQEDI